GTTLRISTSSMPATAATNPVLHSFPTRRSSDLKVGLQDFGLEEPAEDPLHLLGCGPGVFRHEVDGLISVGKGVADPFGQAEGQGERKSTRLNCSHVKISYAVVCLKTKMVSRLLD